MGLITDRNREIITTWDCVMEPIQIYSWSGWKGIINRACWDRIREMGNRILRDCMPSPCADVLVRARDLFRELCVPASSRKMPMPIPDQWFKIGTGILTNDMSVRLRDNVLDGINVRIGQEMRDILERYDLVDIVCDTVRLSLANRTILMFMDVSWFYRPVDGFKEDGCLDTFDMATLSTECKLWDC